MADKRLAVGLVNLSSRKCKICQSQRQPDDVRSQFAKAGDIIQLRKMPLRKENPESPDVQNDLRIMISQSNNQHNPDMPEWSVAQNISRKCSAIHTTNFTIRVTAADCGVGRPYAAKAGSDTAINEKTSAMLQRRHRLPLLLFAGDGQIDQPAAQ
ncbi:MAG: hypothetical protein R3C26_10465 [Calditrichia bacterium]